MRDQKSLAPGRNNGSKEGRCEAKRARLREVATELRRKAAATIRLNLQTSPTQTYHGWEAANYFDLPRHSHVPRALAPHHLKEKSSSGGQRWELRERKVRIPMAGRPKDIIKARGRHEGEFVSLEAGDFAAVRSRVILHRHNPFPLATGIRNASRTTRSGVGKVVPDSYTDCPSGH